ncbi:MltA domain-containing protein [Paucibacter sp. DJ1R-11]|uniref:murein transglycosylase A n=1 Tax=Paucibacter sp. DJ1R-11 TaxID=2893556 RepID=UPI0021E42FEB|nr:MltA domain-containing protein [Paucibacter sp. DJ1R-11]MCV2364852.1 MltA domain-containing protein [Paucibacter sp. DJ1R-11]
MMNTNSAKAPKASSKSNPIAASIPSSQWLRQGAAGAILGLLAACSSTPLPPEPPARPPAAEIAPEREAASPSRPRQVLQRERSRWVAVDWIELPGWGEDRAAELWPALLQGCARPAAGWAELCARALRSAPGDDHAVTLWLMQHLQAYRVESPEGETQGLLTGYFEPMLDATRKPQGDYQVPVHAAPVDLQQRRPYFSRQQLEGEQRQRLRGLELAYLDDPLDLLILQIQGSGRLRIKANANDDSGTWVRLAFAGHNDHPYQSIGKALIERGELRPGEASWSGIRDWMRRKPQQARELLWGNPRYVFFREEPLVDPNVGPRGAQGVPLTPGRSVAVDRASIPYGTALWLEAGDPLQSGNSPLRRLVMAQDTGSAITGAVRADFFWGWGREAETQAGRMKQPLRLWALWPRGKT